MVDGLDQFSADIKDLDRALRWQVNKLNAALTASLNLDLGSKADVPTYGLGTTAIRSNWLRAKSASI